MEHRIRPQGTFPIPGPIPPTPPGSRRTRGTPRWFPAGVRLELVGDAQAIDIAYRTTSGNLGYRGDGAGITFSVWRAGRKVCEEEAVLGDGLIRLSLGSSAPDKPATIYLPEGMQPLIQSLTAVKGEISPAPALPRWIAYGDSVTQGWIASGPAQGWAAIAARKSGLDLANMGYAAAGRGEIVSAEHIAALPADIISVAYGASCWTRVPHSVGMVAEGFMAFLDVVRDGHPTVPIVVISPFVRPDAEDEPNRLGATLAEIRHAIESATRDRIVSGDETLALVAGGAIITADHLGDGIHPDDEGHKRIAATVSKALTQAIKAATDLPGPETLKLTTKPIRSSGHKERDKVRVRERNKRRGEEEDTKVEVDVEPGVGIETGEDETDEVEVDGIETGEDVETDEVETDEVETDEVEVDETAEVAQDDEVRLTRSRTRRSTRS